MRFGESAEFGAASVHGPKDWLTLQVPGRGGDTGGEVEVAVRPDGLRLALFEIGLIKL